MLCACVRACACVGVCGCVWVEVEGEEGGRGEGVEGRGKRGFWHEIVDRRGLLNVQHSLVSACKCS